MICADTSSLLAFWAGDAGPDVDLVDQAYADRLLALSPVSLSKLLSKPSIPSYLEKPLLRIPLLEILPGYWERAGRLRAKVLGHRLRANLPDALIAQSCLDHGVPLVTRDRDFLVFQRFARLRLL